MRSTQFESGKPHAFKSDAFEVFARVFRCCFEEHPEPPSVFLRRYARSIEPHPAFHGNSFAAFGEDLKIHFLRDRIGHWNDRHVDVSSKYIPHGRSRTWIRNVDHPDTVLLEHFLGDQVSNTASASSPDVSRPLIVLSGRHVGL